MKHVAIINKELVPQNIKQIAKTILELCEINSCHDCYFNKDKWFTLFQYLIAHTDINTTLSNLDLTKLYLYGADWFDYFGVRNNQIVVYNLRHNDLLYDLVKTHHIGYHILFRYYVVYTSSRKNVKAKLDRIRHYPNVYQHILLRQDVANLDQNLPKSWVDNLPKLNTYLDNPYLLDNYFDKNCFAQQIEITRCINKYVKKYGKTFIELIQENCFDILNDEVVQTKVFMHLRKNNKLLVDPLPINNNYLGIWRVVELTTKLSFVDESDIQNHCIGRGDGYVNQVIGGRLRAFSFRKLFAGKESRYTVTYVRSGSRWEVCEENGVNNRKKDKLYDVYDLKCLEINMERVKQDLDKYQIQSSKEEKFL